MRSVSRIILRCLLILTFAADWVEGADLTTAMPVVAREVAISNVLVLRPKAERGNVAAQVALGDLFGERQQFGEAVYWYRLAATNGEVTAQLALASCLIAGKGAAENRTEAAYWMRRAADGVERAGRERPAPATAPIILTRSNAAPAAIKSPTNSAAIGASEKNLFTKSDSRSTRTTRDDNLSVAEPSLQERSVGLQPSNTPK